MSIEFYIPQQGDTAGTVTDGYASNFEALDTAKADAQTVAEALAGKVDKADGEHLMTSAEREKLSGIEAGANAYTHPESHPADMIADTAGKVIMTSAEREKLSGIEAGANAYTLPAASASALGGIKVGRNLSIDAEGRLSAVGGSGSGDGILVLPHVAPERDADGNLTNSAAFVDAWGGIFSEYLAAPDSHALYMETEAGEGLMLRIPCNVMNIGSDADMVQWLISGFTVVNVPMSSSEPVSCKATVMAAVICNAAGEMQSLAMYAGEGIAAADGSPNLLGSDDAVIIDLGLDTGAMDEAKLKAAVQPVLAKLMTPTPPRVIVKCNAFYINGTFQTVGSQFIITAYGAHPYTVGDVNNTYIIRAGVIGTVANGTITTVQGGYVGQELTTTEAVKTAINEIPYVGENLVLKSNAHPGAGQGFIQYNLSESLKSGECVTITLRGETPGNAAFSMGFLTSDQQYQGDIWSSSFEGSNKTLSVVVPDYPNDVIAITFYFTSPGIQKPCVKLERGAKATPWCLAAADTPALPDYSSLEEQLVPGEFWNGKQVYVRSFKGSVHGAVGGNYIAKNCFKSNTVDIVEVKGSINGFLAGDNVTRYSLPVGTSFSVRAENNSLAYSTDRADMGAMIYTLTVKYTL